MHRVPDPRRGVASQTSLKILSLLGGFQRCPGRGRGRSSGRPGWGFFRGIFSRAAKCKRRSRNVNLTTFSKRGRRVGSICLRALNALLGAAEPVRIHMYTRPYTPREFSLNKTRRALNQFFEAPAGILLREIIRPLPLSPSPHPLFRIRVNKYGA